MNKTTNTPTAVAAQPKTLAQKIEETQELEKKLWALTIEAEQNLQPFKAAYSEACRKWSEVNRRLEMLTEMQKEATV